MKVMYLYPSDRRQILEKYKEGTQPDTLLVGYNHLIKYSIQGGYDYPKYNFAELIFKCFDRVNKFDFYFPLKVFPALSDYDVIVAKDVRVGFLYALLKKVSGWNKPLIFLDVVFREEVPLARVTGSVLSAADKLIYCASSLKNILQNLLNIPEDKLIYIPWCVDTKFFQPINVKMEDFILSVGTNDRDFKTLKKAIEEIDNDLELRIATNRTDLEEDNSKRIRTYYLSPIKLKEFYAKSKFAVIPLFDSVSASGVTSILEAMAMEKAVIVSRSSGIMDYVIENETAIIVPQQDYKALRDAIVYLNRNPSIAEQMGKNGRRLVEEKFNTQKQAQRLVELYIEVYNSR